MKLAPTLRLLALLAFLTFNKAQAASGSFGLTVIPSTTTASVNGLINYNVTLANNTGLGLLNSHLLVTFPTTLTIISNLDNVTQTTIDPGENLILTSGGSIDFRIGQFPDGQAYSFFVSLKMTQTNAFTTTFIASNQVQNLVVSTNIVTGGASSGGTDTNTTGNTDLSVTLSTRTSAALVNDLITYTLTARNNGPKSASKVIVNNTVPTGTKLVSSTAASAVSMSANVITWQVGTLAANASQALTLTIQPTNAVGGNITAAISAPSNTDTVTSNDTTTNSISIQPIVTSNLLFTRGGQTFNRNTGLFEETETIQNIGSIVLPTTRIFVSGGLATNDFVYNVGGTNGTTPYVLFTNALAPGAISNVLVQFYFHDRKFNTSQTLTAVQGPVTSTNVATTNVVSSTLAITNVLLTNNVVTFEFPTATNQTFFVQQSGDVFFTNATTLARTNLIVGTNKIVLNRPIDLTTNQFFRAVQNP